MWSSKIRTQAFVRTLFSGVVKLDPLGAFFLSLAAGVALGASADGGVRCAMFETELLAHGEGEAIIFVVAEGCSIVSTSLRAT